jgi:hypothetical protein
MAWLAGALVLTGAALLLRRLLRINEQSPRRLAGLLPLSSDREKIYEPLAREIETQDAILGISLNDAFEERDSGHEDISWRLIRLSASEWERQQEILTGLLSAVLKHLGQVGMVIPLRRLSADGFKSPTMMDFVRMNELLDQFVFRSKLRFQLRMRVLRRATAALTSEFRRACRYGEGPDGRPPELWRRLDLLYHDFDLVTKETLMAYRAYLFSLPHPALDGFAADLERLTNHVARAVSVRSEE